MSQPISIPKRRKKVELLTSYSCPNFSKLDGLLIYPGSFPHGMRVNSNYNSYKILCSMIGSNPVSKEILHSSGLTYTLYYDVESQSSKPKTGDFNSTISWFTGSNYWGRILIVDPNPRYPIIKILEEILDRPSI